jgi:copper transport protein
MRPAMFLHGIGVAFWLGALVPSAVPVWLPKEAPLAALNRFFRTAIPAVGLLLLAGLALAIVQLESFEALVETKYGLILSIKPPLVAALLGLAAPNRFRLVPALARDRQVGATAGTIDPAQMRRRGAHSRGRSGLALCAAAAHSHSRYAAGGPHSHKQGDVPGTGFAGQGGARTALCCS